MIKQPLLSPTKRSRKRIAVQPKNKTQKLSSEIKRLANQINRASFYERLNVSSQASDSEIKKAFQKLSLKVHPDCRHLRMATCLFQRICEAKDCLLDPMKRQLYDQSLNQPKTDVMADSQTDFEASDSDDGWSRMDNVDMNYQPVNVVMDEFFDRVFSNREAIYNDLSLFSTNLFLKDNGTIPWTDIPNSLNPIETNPRLDQYIDRVLELYGVNQINYKHCSIFRKVGLCSC